MKFPHFLALVLLISLSFTQLAMSRRGQYDEEARQAEREERKMHKETKKNSNPAKEIVSGVKEATVDSAAGLIADTADATATEKPVVGTLEGARRGSEKLLRHTVKGVSKVATLGYGEVDDYEVVEPAKDSEETTKIKIKIPGT